MASTPDGRTPTGGPVPASAGQPSAAARFLQFVPLGAVAVLLLDAATDFFPDDPITGILTPTRLVLLIGLTAMAVPAPGRPRARLRDFRTRLDIPVGLLLVASVLATYGGGHPTAPLRGLLTVIACYYLVVGLRRTQPESWRAVGLLALAGVAAAGTGAFSQFTNDTPTGLCRTGLLTDIACDAGGDVLIRATGTFANPNLLAAFLVLLLPFTLLAAVAVDERTARTAIVVLGVVGYGALLTTFSRAGYVAAAAGLLVLGGAYWFAPRLADRTGRRLVAGISLGGLLAASAAIWFASRAGNSLGVRGQAWRAALDLAPHNPLGVGLGRSGAVITATAPGDRVFVHAHNLWLNWLVETGPLGLLAIGAVTVIAWTSAARAARAKSVVGTVGLASLTGFFLMSMLDHPANLDRIDVLFWCVLAVVMAEAPTGRRRSAEPPADTVPARQRHRRHAPAAPEPAGLTTRFTLPPNQPNRPWLQGPPTGP
ncbi:O-antigen ligase family protein [Streptomyces cylindrosporus]|uniref:O-antigen ligase family protein n=1 Tax=Streptomyces cylindrosporus TaxID=2927583 RepID=A0ABS9Y9S2_9ACTN|nr:O-antigen ligase family protein [Streptomyces cylindrosporus]MCI3273980.1 O-antigen ligase family protein [Streptomyces cylindrosporus]